MTKEAINRWFFTDYRDCIIPGTNLLIVFETRVQRTACIAELLGPVQVLSIISVRQNLRILMFNTVLSFLNQMSLREMEGTCDLLLV
jgi:hypothetical protein